MCCVSSEVCTLNMAHFAEGKNNGRSTKGGSDFLIFAKALSYDLLKFSEDFTPFFRL